MNCFCCSPRTLVALSVASFSYNTSGAMITMALIAPSIPILRACEKSWGRLVRRSLRFGALDIALLCNCHNFVTDATKPYKSATVLLQFGNIFPTPERHTSFRTYNVMHVLEAIIPYAYQEGNKCLNYNRKTK